MSPRASIRFSTNIVNESIRRQDHIKHTVVPVAANNRVDRQVLDRFCAE
ncbi:MAG: hypothetical protein M3430_05320 [Acidobacteriota bacterium]|nr:hypothetical protein [Acidobacteriota bacterium]